MVTERKVTKEPKMAIVRKMVTIRKKMTKRKGAIKLKMETKMVTEPVLEVERTEQAELDLERSMEKGKMEVIKKKLVTEIMINAKKRTKINKQVS